MWQYARLRGQLCDAGLMELFDQTIAMTAAIITMMQAAEEPQDQAAKCGRLE